MTKEIKNIAASIHDRLLHKARQEGQTFEQLFYYYALERLLYRLYQSRYSQDFVLKGGLMFFGWGLPLRRPTRDIDLQAYTANSIDNLVKIFREVCSQTVEPPDGMEYDPGSMQGEAILNDADYHGVRVRIQGRLQRMPIWLHVDVSFANLITPGEVTAEYPTLLGMPPFKIRGYPYETTIAEKFQAMVALDLANDRLKDFYDIWLISQKFEIQGVVLAHAMANTFRARNTPFPAQIPTALTDRFANEKQAGWARFVKKLPIQDNTPVVFSEVLAELRTFLFPAMQAAATDGDFLKLWHTGAGWG